MSLPKHCIICRLMAAPKPPETIIRWVGTGPYEDFNVTFPVCNVHAERLKPNEALLEKLMNQLLGLET